MAVRSALGAGRLRLVRQLLTESVILSAAGGGLGLLLAVWGVDALVALEPQGIPRLSDVRVDTNVVLFTMGLSVLTGVLFGLVPAFQSTGPAMATTLKEGGRGSLSTRGGARMRGALVVAEMALAVVLLAGAGLLIRSFTKLASVDPGFHADQALTFELSLPESRYEHEPQQIAFFDQLLPRLRALPGVRDADAVMSLPLSGSNFNISALGAQERTVLGLVVRQAMMLAGGGVAIGIVCALLLSRSLVAALLFSTRPHDAVTFATVAALLTAVALAASYIPARRATRVDPIVALRSE